MNTFMHIGLHKTTTRYQQRMLPPVVAGGWLGNNPSSLSACDHQTNQALFEWLAPHNIPTIDLSGSKSSRFEGKQ